MATDTITAQFTISADFETIQAMRHLLADQTPGRPLLYHAWVIQ